MRVRFMSISAAVLLLASACEESTPEAGDAVRPECPDHRFIPRDIRGAAMEAVVIPLVGHGALVPEVNDCQPLVDTAGYGPVVAIFARQDSLPTTLVSGTWYLTAVIFNFGSLGRAYHPYAPLSLVWGFHCLYLRLADPIQEAVLTAQGENENCADAIPAPTGHVLEARVRPKISTNDMVPRAARWEWDLTNNQQYIGVACGLQWCEIGNSGFISAADPDVSWISTIPELAYSAEHRIRGYFDVQTLAVPNPTAGPNNPVILSTAQGTFFPSPNLASMTDLSAEQYVGTMIVTGSVPTYTEKFGLTAGQPTHIYLKKRTDWLSFFSTKKYKARFATGDNEKVIMIRRRAHDDFHIPGMVRWRWLWDDETTWVKCLEGCCSTQ
jgi:hypothetical protein